MAESTYVKVKRDGTVVLADSGAANTYTLSYENGDLKFNKAKTDQVVIYDRSTIVGCRSGNDPVLSGAFSVHYRQWASAASENLCDVLDGVNSGSAAGWAKVSSDFEQWNLNMTMTVAGGEDGTNSVANFGIVVFEWDFAEGDPDQLNVSFNCYGGITFTGPA